MESEARKLSLAAFKKKEPGMFKAFSNMNMKLEEAASLFIDSANKFKGAKNCAYWRADTHVYVRNRRRRGSQGVCGGGQLLPRKGHRQQARGGDPVGGRGANVQESRATK